MGRALAACLWLLLLVPSATAADNPTCASATRVFGAAPLRVTLSATCEATAYRWDFGDGTSAEGRSVEHTFARGTFRPVLSAMLGNGTPLTETLRIDAFGVSLAAPRQGGYQRPVLFRGRVAPIPPDAGRLVVALYGPGRRIGTAPAEAGGAFRMRTRLRGPGPYEARVGGASSAPVTVLVEPRLEAAFRGSGAVGEPLGLDVRVQPAAAGVLRVRVWRGGRLRVDERYRRSHRIRLDTRREATFRVSVATIPAAGFVRASRSLRLTVALPRLAYGSTGPAVTRLRQRLGELGYAVGGSSSAFDGPLLDAVYAFQKTSGLPRTGTIDAAAWRRLDRARRPAPRFRGSELHLEVDKTRQVLFVVRRGRVALVVPVSTAGLAGTFTPEGRFGVYRKVSGFDPSPLGVLYDPLYFTGGYAIHGNPSVPPYPASHGCIRVPMWIASYLYEITPHGTAVEVYS